MQLRHAVGLGALPLDHHHAVLIQLTTGKELIELVLIVDNHSRCFHHSVLLLHRRNLDNRPAQIALEQLKTAVALKRLDH